ncbi:MAG: type II toxin-antitoxin system RelE/ParE family toxin [Deltaproteobacteria bacterium]|nr:MAG: type II toxin-antitoxin system RelE/ParE family toxin [Deltaproteobacteria bacterium]
MARVVYSRNALANLERAFDFLAEHDPDAAVDAASAIQSAVDALAPHPLIGRRLRGEIRELVISFGRTGYVALYRFVPARDEVRVLAIRHERELDYPT